MNADRLRSGGAGYSGTPLLKKLGIKEGTRLFITGAPDVYVKSICPLPSGATISTRLTDRVDVIHFFTTQQSRLETALRNALKSMKPDATIWVSWPKKASKVKTDISEDVIRDIALPMGLVDVKVCAIDDTWSGLKLVIRQENRPAAKKTSTRRSVRKTRRQTT